MDSFFLSIVFCLTLLLIIIPSTNSVYFNVPRFGVDTANINYQGDAEASDGVVEINRGGTSGWRVGMVTYSDKVRLWDNKTGKISDFATRFSFIIDTLGQSIFSDGMAFFLAAAEFHIPPNSYGGLLGLFNSDLSQDQIAAVEFDTYSNEWDPPYGHVGIDINSIDSTVDKPCNFSAHSGVTTNVWISYTAATKNLTVSWNYTSTSYSNDNSISSLSHLTDLTQHLPEWVIIGFSAATGSHFERHILRSWEFNSSLNTNLTTNKSTPRSRKIKIFVGSIAAVACLFIAGAVLAVLTIISRRAGTRRNANLTRMSEDIERGAGPKRFSYQQLASATNNFSNQRKLGEGGSGTVYKGYLTDHTAIAVKKISRGAKKGKQEYVNELKTIGQLRHRNLVQLLGWCHDIKGDFLIVYEFMPNGSLDSHLFGKKVPLSWPVRYKATLGIASALFYLHEEWEQCVVHRDLKSSNIMVDSNFNVKLGDFGLARLIQHGIGPQTTVLAGTRGYMAPEYINTGRASKESDVYSFGVVALEIATGRNAVGIIQQRCEMSLVQWVWDLYGKGSLNLAVDERLNGEFDEKQVECLMVVGLWCAHPDYTQRPSIKQAIQAINFETPLPNLPEKMPVPIYNEPEPALAINSAASVTHSSLQEGR